MNALRIYRSRGRCDVVNIGVHRGEFVRQCPLMIMIYGPAGGFGGAVGRFIGDHKLQFEPKWGVPVRFGTKDDVKTIAITPITHLFDPVGG